MSVEFGHTVADRVFEQPHDAFVLLAQRPPIGQVRPEFATQPCAQIGSRFFANDPHHQKTIVLISTFNLPTSQSVIGLA